MTENSCSLKRGEKTTKQIIFNYKGIIPLTIDNKIMEKSLVNQNQISVFQKQHGRHPKQNNKKGDLPKH